MIKNEPDNLENHNEGFSLIEVVVAMGVLAIFVCVFAMGSALNRSLSSDLSESTSCNTLTSGITNLIKAYDNSLVVRNWLPKFSSGLNTAQALSDPFCNDTEGRIPICDTINFFMLKKESKYIEPEDIRNFQNVRGAFSWAQNVYNTYKDSGICYRHGLTLSPSQLQKLLPSRTVFPEWVRDFQLFMKDSALDCGQLSTSKDAKVDIRITARFERRIGDTQLDICTSAISLTSLSDNDPPTLSVQAFQNLAGVPGDPIPDGGCTDTRTVDEIIAAGGPGTSWNSVFIELLTNEPGTLLTCRRASTFAFDEPGKFHNCPDLPLDGKLIMTPNESTVTYNTPLEARIAMTNMPDRPLDIHVYEVKAIDVGGNESEIATTRFRVHSPACISSDLYCPDASPASPTDPLRATFQGIGVQPWDDCFNGLCPIGTRPSICNPVMQASLCTTETFADDCGRDTCTGSATPSCAGINLALIPCDEDAFGPCGMNCGKGEKDCAGSPPPPPPPTPPPGCNCDSVDLAALACGTFTADSCGTVGTCGPGTQACPPTPTPLPILPPWAAPWGAFQCTDKQKKTCKTNFSGLPAGYTDYELEITVLAMRFDKTATASVVITLQGATTATYSHSGSTPTLGPENPPSHAPVPAFPTQTIKVKGTGGIPMVSVTVTLEDASVQIFWNAKAVSTP